MTDTGRSLLHSHRDRHEPGHDGEQVHVALFQVTGVQRVYGSMP